MEPQPVEGSVPMTETSQRPPSGSDGSSTPMVLPRQRSMATKLNQAPLNVRQVIDTLRRPRKRTTDSGKSNRLSKNGQDFDESELYFLSWLDKEIGKIDDFYQAKETEAADRYKLLSEQLEALRRLRNQQRLASSTISSLNQTGTPSRSEQAQGFGTVWLQKPISRLRASMDAMSSAMPAADHERRASKHPELMAHPISTHTGYAEYRVAKRRLRQAVLEFYRGLELLKAYRLLNRTGFSKILKKFDKMSGRRISDEYNEKIKALHFDQSEILGDIMEHTEVFNVALTYILIV